jgi:hypothetical protein
MGRGVSVFSRLWPTGKRPAATQGSALHAGAALDLAVHICYFHNID